jgi:hypothetical protein
MYFINQRKSAENVMPIRRKVKRTDFEPCVARIDDSMATGMPAAVAREPHRKRE